MHTLFLFCYYCFFVQSAFFLIFFKFNTLYYSELKMTEELSKHVFKEFNVLYKTIKANLNVKCSSLPQTKQTISLVSMFLLNLS